MSFRKESEDQNQDGKQNVTGADLEEEPYHAKAMGVGSNFCSHP
jgi:hypothetical protein